MDALTFGCECLHSYLSSTYYNEVYVNNDFMCVENALLTFIRRLFQHNAIACVGAVYIGHCGLDDQAEVSIDTYCESTGQRIDSTSQL